MKHTTKTFQLIDDEQLLKKIEKIVATIPQEPVVEFSEIKLHLKILSFVILTVLFLLTTGSFLYTILPTVGISKAYTAPIILCLLVVSLVGWQIILTSCKHSHVPYDQKAILDIGDIDQCITSITSKFEEYASMYTKYYWELAESQNMDFADYKRDWEQCKKEKINTIDVLNRAKREITRAAQISE